MGMHLEVYSGSIGSYGIPKSVKNGRNTLSFDRFESAGCLWWVCVQTNHTDVKH